jgi:hypothetical protein
MLGTANAQSSTNGGCIAESLAPIHWYFRNCVWNTQKGK